MTRSYKNPEDWGWTIQNNMLSLVTTLKAPAFVKLLKYISNSIKGCGKNRGCRKAGFK
jgi:hypothetical protein